jgi:hypothetical protein
VEFKNAFDVSVPFGKIKHYLFKQIFGRYIRQVDYSFNYLWYAVWVAGNMKPGNDA